MRSSIGAIAHHFQRKGAIICSSQVSLAPIRTRNGQLAQLLLPGLASA